MKTTTSKDTFAAKAPKPIRANSDTSASEKEVDTVTVTSKKQILGTWQETYKEELTVEISPVKFTYKEHHESYPYKIDRDSLRIFFREIIVTGKLYLISDTLLIKSPSGEFKYVRLPD